MEGGDSCLCAPAQRMRDFVNALKNALVSLMLLPRFVLAAVLLWLLDFVCIRRKVLVMREREDSTPDDPPVTVSDSNRMFTLESLRAVWYSQKLDFCKTAHLGLEAPNSEYADIADSLLIYIEEAHPSDGWVSTDAPYQIPRHRCIKDRIRAARLMNAIVPGSAVVVDTMDNSSNTAYGAYFERLYVVKDEKVVYQGGRGPEGYRISELRNWLEQYRHELQSSTPVVVQV
ncbi:iodothyronine deiodinase 3b [Tachysurus ichikawai]